MSDELKWCPHCESDKSVDDFHKNRAAYGGRQGYCKECKYKADREWMLQRRKENYGNVAIYLRSHPCVGCGEADIIVLDFDHQGDKVKSISDMCNQGCPWSKIEAEIAKCEVVCKNCHYRRTVKQQNHPRHRMVEEMV